jgi:hypothetical protein
VGDRKGVEAICPRGRARFWRQNHARGQNHGVALPLRAFKEYRYILHIHIEMQIMDIYRCFLDEEFTETDMIDY